MSQSLTVELIGAARIIAGCSEVTVTLSEGATWRDITETLGRAVPALVGEVIARDGRDLLGAYTFNLGGRDFVGGLDELVEPPESGRATLMDFSDL